MALSIGSQAPDFTLKHKTAEGLQEVTLSDNFGKSPTVLLFFPLAFTSVCVAEMCAVRDSISEYQNLNASVYGISVDSPFTLEVMASKDSIPFPLLSDFNKEVATAYGVLYEELLGFKGVAKRSAFVVDTTGKIVFASSSDDPKQLPDFAAIQQTLADLK
ncbi:MAG: redoxin domain-containing protein [Puniceicoccaceae bacterium]